MQTMIRYGTRDLARAKTFDDGIAEVLGATRTIDRLNLVGVLSEQRGKAGDCLLAAANGSQIEGKTAQSVSLFQLITTLQNQPDPG